MHLELKRTWYNFSCILCTDASQTCLFVAFLIAPIYLFIAFLSWLQRGGGNARLLVHVVCKQIWRTLCLSLNEKFDCTIFHFVPKLTLLLSLNNSVATLSYLYKKHWLHNFCIFSITQLVMLLFMSRLRLAALFDVTGTYISHWFYVVLCWLLRINRVKSLRRHPLVLAIKNDKSADAWKCRRYIKGPRERTGSYFVEKPYWNLF